MTSTDNLAPQYPLISLDQFNYLRSFVNQAVQGFPKVSKLPRLDNAQSVLHFQEPQTVSESRTNPPSLP
jgi:hypothetical protein